MRCHHPGGHISPKSWLRVELLQGGCARWDVGSHPVAFPAVSRWRGGFNCLPLGSYSLIIAAASFSLRCPAARSPWLIPPPLPLQPPICSLRFCILYWRKKSFFLLSFLPLQAFLDL